MDRKWLLVSVALLVLIASNAFLVYTISEQKSSIDSLKQSNAKLLGQLSESNKIIENLRGTVEQQEKEISALERDIDRYRNYTLVHMLICMNPTYLTSDFYTEIQAVEEAMKFIWDPLHIMFVFQIHVDSDAPAVVRYWDRERSSAVLYFSLISTEWSSRSVFVLLASIQDTLASGQGISGYALVRYGKPRSIVLNDQHSVFCSNVGQCIAHILTHEFLHLLGFTDEVLYPWDAVSNIGAAATYIPPSWYPEIYDNIVRFEISNPTV